MEHYDEQYERVTKVKAHNGRVLASAYTNMDGQRPLYITGGSDSTLTIWNIRDHLQEGQAAKKTSNEKLVEALRQFVSFRTVSSDPRYQTDCRRGASHLRSLLKNFGAQTEISTMNCAPTQPTRPFSFGCVYSG